MVLPLAQPAMASRVGSFTVMYADCAVVIKLNTKSEGGTRSSTATISSREEVLRQGQLEVAPAFHGAECEADRLRGADALRRAARPTHGTGAGGALR